MATKKTAGAAKAAPAKRPARRKPANGAEALQDKVRHDAENGVELTPEQQQSVEEAMTAGTRKRQRKRGPVNKVIGVDPNRRVVDERGRVKRQLSWVETPKGWKANETDAELVQQKQRDGKMRWVAKLWGSDAGRFATLSGAKAFADDAFNLDPVAMSNGDPPEQTAKELTDALANLGEKDDATVIDLDKRRDAAVNRAKERLQRLNEAKTTKARHEAAQAASGRKVPVTDADVEAVKQNLADQRAAQRRAANEITKKARAAKRAAERGNTPRAEGGERHNECPLCGFKFKTPKARCGSTAACEKRQAERGTYTAEQRRTDAIKSASPKKAAPKKAAPKKAAPKKAAPTKKAAPRKAK